MRILDLIIIDTTLVLPISLPVHYPPLSNTTLPFFQKHSLLSLPSLNFRSHYLASMSDKENHNVAPKLRLNFSASDTRHLHLSRQRLTTNQRDQESPASTQSYLHDLSNPSQNLLQFSTSSSSSTSLPPLLQRSRPNLLIYHEQSPKNPATKSPTKCSIAHTKRVDSSKHPEHILKSSRSSPPMGFRMDSFFEYQKHSEGQSGNSLHPTRFG